MRDIIFETSAFEQQGMNSNTKFAPNSGLKFRANSTRGVTGNYYSLIHILKKSTTNSSSILLLNHSGTINNFGVSSVLWKRNEFLVAFPTVHRGNAEIFYRPWNHLSPWHSKWHILHLSIKILNVTNTGLETIVYDFTRIHKNS